MGPTIHSQKMLGAAGRAATGLVKQATKAGNVANVLPAASVAQRREFSVSSPLVPRLSAVSSMLLETQLMRGVQLKLTSVKLSTLKLPLSKTNLRSQEPGRSRDSSLNLSRSLRSSPATPANLSLFPRPSLGSRRSSLASTTICQRLLSTWLETLMKLSLRLTVWPLNEENRLMIRI